MENVIASELSRLVGSDHVLTDAKDMASYARDWRGRFSGSPTVVVRPGSTTEVAAIMAQAAANRWSIVPQGGNTGYTGGGIPDSTGGQIILSLGRMNRIRSLDRANDTIVAEAGCTLWSVQQAAQKADRLFPLSLGSEGSCQIGGNIATNAGGLEVLRYGPMRDLVLGLEVVLPSGEVLARIAQLRKNNTGYDLKQLFIGSEGTLGVITAAALKIFPRPRAAATAICGVPSPEAALEILGLVKQKSGTRLSTFEILSQGQMDIVTRHTNATFPLAGRHPWYLLIELTDAAPGPTLADLMTDVLSVCAEANLLSDAVLAQTEAQRAAFWALRHMVSEGNNRAGRPVSHDTSVPVSSAAAFIKKVEQAFSGRCDVTMVFVGHLGDGNVHSVAIFDHASVGTGQFEDSIRSVSQTIYEIAAELGGSISAEHGIGISLRDTLPAFKDPTELSLMRSIKAVFDPNNIMNPGKVLAEGPLYASLAEAALRAR